MSAAKNISRLQKGTGGPGYDVGRFLPDLFRGGIRLQLPVFYFRRAELARARPAFAAWSWPWRGRSRGPCWGRDSCAFWSRSWRGGERRDLTLHFVLAACLPCAV